MSAATDTVAVATASETAAQIRRIADLVADCSIEIIPTDEAAIQSLSAVLPAGATVYVAAPPARSQNDIVETARHLRRAGYRPVPHVAARSFADSDRLADFLWRLRSAANIDQVLLVGGDRRQPIGDFATALDVLKTGLFEEFGIRRVGLAGHPEGHSEVDDGVLFAALGEKLAYGREHGLAMQVVTQFCFDPHAVVDWTGRLRRSFGAVPVHVGVPGPGSLTGLVKFARLCKIGASVRLLTRGIGPALKLASWTPDQFLTALATYRTANPQCGIAGVHFFSFGGTARTAAWCAAVAAGRLTLHGDGRGFSIAPATETSAR